MNKQWIPPMDNRTSGLFKIPVRPFITDTDTVIPQRHKVERNWLDKILRRQRMKTVWVSKRRIRRERIHAMFTQTINCRCSVVKTL